jgi:RNA polymerase subunit RPABC4/transcription elongation factor Spt4
VSDAFLAILLVDALIFGFAAGTIRKNQGGSFGEGFAWGAFLGIIGLIVVAATKPNAPVAGRVPAGPIPGSPPRPDLSAEAGDRAELLASTPANPSEPATPIAMRECPSCKEAMRRDASVCPHCRRESDAWSYRGGRWWTRSAEGKDVWLSSSGTWLAEEVARRPFSREHYECPHCGAFMSFVAHRCPHCGAESSATG